MAISVRQQRQVASAFDSEPADAGILHAYFLGDTALGMYPTAFGDVVFQRSDIFIVDPLNAFRGETAEPHTEITCHMASLQNLSIQSARHAEPFCSDRSLPCKYRVKPLNGHAAADRYYNS